MEEQTLADYKIIKQIGEGTLGKVLLAEHRFIKKQYVLKVLPPELCQDDQFMRRFEEEVAKLAKLDHPHIVKVHNVSCAEGLYFLVTDCMVDSIGETTNLAQYMAGRGERLRENELISLLTQIADALDYAHTKGQVVHQALKLNNILIGKGRPGIDVFISDFGLAAVVSPGKVIARSFKCMAHALGALPVKEENEELYAQTPVKSDTLSKLSQSFLQGFAFLAPEQKRFEHVGVQADTYAFGVLAYYLISGKFPEGVFEMPSSLAPEYSCNLDPLITQCLQQDPKRRPTQLLPLLQNRRLIEPLVLKVTEATRETPPTIEKLKTSLEKELKPIINRQNPPKVPVAEPQEVAAVVVEGKDVAEATPPPITPPKDESYSQALNSMLNRDPVVTEYQPEKKEKVQIEPLQTEMVVIHAGEFLRGSNEGKRDEMPAHKIYLDSFAIDIHPVTNEQYVRFLEDLGDEKDQNYNDLIRLKDSRITRSGGKLSIEPGYSKHPVVGVTWYGARSYANWAGKRLPTEGEWEIAARGGLEGALYPTGHMIDKNQANFFSSDTSSVMSYPPNGYGLYDMAGNVYEWCHDWYGYSYYDSSAQEPDNPKGPRQGVYRVLRGGCWKSLMEDMRSSHRHRNNPGTVNSTCGFRCAANVQ
ncbi:MAG: bifunctional serine/threonine-protein kinase/formylglycine-generating enzyme family protein [Chlamydiales bacterium]